MAKIHALPSLEIIRGLKGILDFYVHRGVPCVRAWPRYRPARQTAASLAAALVFGAIVKSYGLLGDLPLEAYRQDARDQTRTPRDIMVTGVYGNLHEASMSDFLTLLQESRDFLSQLTALLNALDSASLDELDVNVEASVLPTGAATAAAQATALTAQQYIAKLPDALQSIALDRIIVRGENQLFSLLYRLRSRRLAVISGANGYIDSETPPADTFWIVTSVAVLDSDNAVTRVELSLRSAAISFTFHTYNAALAADLYHTVQTYKILQTGDTIRADLPGSQAGDNCRVILTGYVMTRET